MAQRTSNARIIAVALVLSLACSALVAVTTVALRPTQQENRQNYRLENILKAAGVWQPGVPLERQSGQIETRLVDLARGEFVARADAAAYDPYRAAQDPRQSIALDKRRDIAGIGRRANVVPVYLVRDDRGGLRAIVLPVHGYGLWSTLYGFIALEPDINTVAGLSFYQHAETPGLGGEVDNPRWKALWPGKQVFDENGNPALRVVKGRVDPGAAQARQRVDGISGATLTTRGVDNLLQFWLGDDGFGPFLGKLRSRADGLSARPPAGS